MPLEESAAGSAPAAGVTPGLIAELRAVLGERLSTAAAVREHHGRDLSYHPGQPPDAVAFAETTTEVAAVVAVAPGTAHR